MDRGAPTDREAVIAACREVARRDPRIAGLYLFGSLAAGEEHAGSDVDLGVLFRTPATLEDVVTLEIRFEEATGRRVDLVDAGRSSPFLALEIVRGDRIYEADPLDCDEFDLYVLRRAGDLAHFERERRRMLLQPIAGRETSI